MRTDLSSIKEADSSVNGVVAYFILLSGAALQHPPPAKRRCNLSEHTWLSYLEPEYHKCNSEKCEARTE
ncbi:hypothetical protein EMCRGX_G023376 [Ephydatia muelleri]